MQKNNLLLLHGALGSSEQMNSIGDMLKKDFEIHYIDFSGHGGKPLPDSLTIDMFCNDVISFMDQSQIAFTHIFGFSMGGYVGLKVAERIGMRIGKIVTLGTKFNWTPETALKESSMLDAEKILQKVPAFAEQLRKRHAPTPWTGVLRKTADLMINLGNKPEWEPGVNHIYNEILLMVGGLDNMVSIDETRLVADNLPKGNIRVLEGMYHPIEKADPAIIASEVAGFLGVSDG